MSKKADLLQLNYISICEAFYKCSNAERVNLIERDNPLSLNDRQYKNMVVIARSLQKLKSENANYNPDKDKRRFLKFIMKSGREQRFCWSHIRAMEYMKERYGNEETTENKTDARV